MDQLSPGIMIGSQTETVRDRADAVFDRYRTEADEIPAENVPE